MTEDTTALQASLDQLLAHDRELAAYFGSLYRLYREQGLPDEIVHDLVLAKAERFIHPEEPEDD